MLPVIAEDLQTYLELDSINAPRAQLLIDLAVTQALDVVTVGTYDESGPTVANLPEAARGVILAAAGRLYVNPQNYTNESAGSFSYGRAAGSGSMFSDKERAAMRRGAGKSRAFSGDMLGDYSARFE